jgi:hypothetical protein
MDLYRIIQELVNERNRIQRLIESLERAEGAVRGRSRRPSSITAGGKRRGRKSMDEAARKEVSERMKLYWAMRRRDQEPPKA